MQFERVPGKVMLPEAAKLWVQLQGSIIFQAGHALGTYFRTDCIQLSNRVSQKLRAQAPIPGGHSEVFVFKLLSHRMNTGSCHSWPARVGVTEVLKPEILLAGLCQRDMTGCGKHIHLSL